MTELKFCEHCNKQLRVGDEAHIVDEQLFCSKECAVLHISHEIAMNAKELAIELYDEKATVLTVRPESDHAACNVCGKDLAKCEIIFAAEGTLLCSRNCGMRIFDEGHFDEVAEEITPDDIGIKPIVTMTRDDIMEALKQLSRSQGRYSRLYNNMMDDSEYRSLMLDELEEQGFTDVIDLVLYFES